MVELCDICLDVADVIDNIRMCLWESIGLYACGCKDKAIRNLEYALDQSKEVLERVLPKLRHEGLKNKLVKAFEETKNEVEKILKLMKSDADIDDIHELQLEVFERKQFNRQHELFHECMLIECTKGGVNGNGNAGIENEELKEFMKKLKKELEAKEVR